MTHIDFELDRETKKVNILWRYMHCLPVASHTLCLYTQSSPPVVASLLMHFFIGQWELAESRSVGGRLSRRRRIVYACIKASDKSRCSWLFSMSFTCTCVHIFFLLRSRPLGTSAIMKSMKVCPKYPSNKPGFAQFSVCVIKFWLVTCIILWCTNNI